MIFDLNKIVRENVKGLKPYSSARDEYVSDGSEMVFLDANENPFENGVNRYPDPQQRALKAVLSERRGVAVTNTLLGNGSDEVLDLLFRAFCEPNLDNVITLPPTYGMYKVLAGVNAIENREVLLNRNFQPEVNAIFKAVDEKSKLLFLCSPNNPTGNGMDAEIIVQLLNEFKGLVVIDEAYVDFSPNESWVKRLSEFPNLVVTHTLSKAYGMAGIRLGICYASKEIIAILNKIKPPYNVNELSQRKALEGVLNYDKVENEVNSIIAEKDTLSKALLEIEYILEIYPSDANFLLAKVDDAQARYNELLAKGIVVRNRSKQPLCESTLRFTIGTSEENRRLVRTLRELE